MQKVLEKFKLIFADSGYDGVLEDIIIGTNPKVTNEDLVANLKHLKYRPEDVLYMFPVFNHKRGFKTEELTSTIKEKYGITEDIKIKSTMLGVTFIHFKRCITYKNVFRPRKRTEG